MRDERFSHLSTFSSQLLQIGGGERDRTDDPLRARQVLSQLSYAPNVQVRLIDNWWAKEDSNLRPHDYQSCALAS